MRQLLLCLIGCSLFLSACRKDEKDDIVCEDAQINMCNPTSDQIFVYGINTNQVTDTLFPGECYLHSTGPLSILFDSDGRVRQSNASTTLLHTPSQTVHLGITSCFWEYQPDFGYIDIAHCYNGIFDPQEREFDTDCGGNCLPCGTINLPCSNLVAGRFTLDNQHFTFASYYGQNQVNNKTILEFTFSNGHVLNVSVPFDDIPSTDKRFITGSEFWESDVWFVDRFGFNRYNSVKGESLYFKVDSAGNQTIQFCDLDFQRSGLIAKGSAHLSIN